MIIKINFWLGDISLKTKVNNSQTQYIYIGSFNFFFVFTDTSLSELLISKYFYSTDPERL